MNPQPNGEHEQFFNFFQISSDLMVIADPNGCFKKINPACLHSLGYSEADLLKKPFIDFVHPDDRQATLDEMAKQIATGFSRNFENRYVCKDGSLRWLSWRANYSATERITYATARDITDRKKAEQDLRESESFYRSILKMLNGFAYCRMIYVDGKPQDFEYLMVNDAFERHTAIKDVVGKRVSELLPGFRESDAHILEIYGRVATCGQPEQFEVFVQALQAWYAISVFSPSPGYFVSVFDNVSTRKQAEEELRLKNSVFDVSIAANSVADIYGNLIQANAAFRRLWGIPKAEEILGRPIADFFMKASEATSVISALNTTSTWEGEFTARRRDGSSFAAHALATVVRNDKGEMIGYQSSVLDISQEREAKSELSLHSTILREIADGVALIRTTDGTIVFANPKFEVMFEYEPGELLGKHVSIINAPTEISPEARAHEIIRCLSEHGVWRGEVLNITKKGTMYWCYSNVSSFEHASYGKVWVTIHKDISERKKAEAVLLASESQLRAIIENSTDAIGVHIDGIWATCNPAAMRLFGIPSLDALIGTSIFDVVAPSERTRVREFVQHRIEGTDAPLQYSTRGLRANGTEFDMDVTVSPYFLENKRHVLVILRDITERMRAEEASRHRQKMESIGVLAGGIAHDFNNLLTAMMGNVSLAKTRLPADHPSVTNLDRTMTAMERAASLTKQMLAYSGKGQYQTASIDLTKLVVDHLALLEVSLPKNVTLRPLIPSPPVRVLGDPGQIQQIVMNLISNGGEAIGENQGVVSIAVSEVTLTRSDLPAYGVLTNTTLSEGAYALLQVSDNGCGMSKETLEKIFDPFFTTKFVGRGLGLAAVLGIVRGHEGGIAVDTAPGVGTTFRVVLPLLIEGADPDPCNNQPGSAPGQRCTVLLIDDEQFIVDVVREMCEHEAIRLLWATDAIVGVQLFEEHWQTIDLVILDYSMPLLNGREALVRLKQIHPQVKVIMSSGYSEEELAHRMGDVRPDAAIEKPHTPQALLALVRQVAERA